MTTPLFVNTRHAAAIVGTNVEMFHTLALLPWFPKPVQFAPGVAYWASRDLEALTEQIRKHFNAIAAGSKRGTTD